MAGETKRDERILDARQMRRIVRRMAGELVEQNEGVEDLLLVGIRTRGVPLAEALAAEIEAMEGVVVARGVLDITLYRDDLSTIAPQPVVKETHIPSSIEGRTVVLCDDVLYTGRTIRAALDALIDYGRAKAVRLAVLIDRGHRELPIQGDVVGQTLATQPDDLVVVAFEATDQRDEVVIKRSSRQE
ncbi:MAG: bifunctional pyr operon transcriptional regulator/uracil phosphoribosyltransferase PyrR [Thermoanaerobaculia bacterium]|nr:bifunctional pyr operon transcriptional regulator/uracil phosphoribosyltransferase PyrR [Thermoanaerobaculia bacterium]